MSGGRPGLHRRLFEWVLSWSESRWGTAALAVLSFTESSFFPVPPDPLLMALALGKRSRSFHYALVCSLASVAGGVLGYVIGFALWNPVGAPILTHLRQLTGEAEKVVVLRVEGALVTVAMPGGGESAVHRSRIHADEPVPDAPIGERDYENDQIARQLVSGDPAWLLADNYHIARAWYDQHGEWIVLVAAFTPIPYKVFTILSGLAGLNLLAFVLASAVGRSARFFLVAGLIYLFGAPIRGFIDRYFNALSLAFVALLVLGFLALKLVV